MWEGWVPPHVVRDGLGGTARVLHWTQVNGPFSACKLTLDRIGWDMSSPTVWITNDQISLDLSKVCPWIVGQHLKRAVRAWQWQQVAKDDELGHLEGGA
eukprot:880185-Pyramimonas_sp.AAC.1